MVTIQCVSCKAYLAIPAFTSKILFHTDRIKSYSMHIKAFPFIVILIAVLTLSPVAAEEPELTQNIRTIDHIVAIVNEEVITRHELDSTIKLAIDRLQSQGMQLPSQQSLERQILETIITKRIQLQHAKEIGMSISESELDETINRIATENKLSLQEFYRTLEEDGISYNKFREEIREEMIMARVKEREVNNQVNVTEGEIDNFLRTKETSAVGNDEYRLAHILVLVRDVTDTAHIQEKSQKAEKALAKLKEGTEFSQVAIEFSDAADATKGGILEWRPASQLGPSFAELVASLQPGELTSVVQSQSGFHIFKLLGRRAQETPTVIVDQTHARHILIKVNELTSVNDAKLKIIQVKERLDKGADFAETAKLYSEDASAASGGDLGWLAPGDTVPDFERAMNALLPDQISEPVQSTFGWHLIQVIDRRSHDISLNRQRQEARQTIRTRKAEVVVQEWMKQLRDAAYIEYRLDDVIDDK